VLQSFDEAGDFQEWCEKCGFVWSNFLHGIYYILGLTNQLKFIITIIVHDFGTNHSLTERKLEQNLVIQTVYNCKASLMRHVVQFPTATPAATDSLRCAPQHFR
jgi:hypothetical protein